MMMLINRNFRKNILSQFFNYELPLVNNINTVNHVKMESYRKLVKNGASLNAVAEQINELRLIVQKYKN